MPSVVSAKFEDLVAVGLQGPHLRGSRTSSWSRRDVPVGRRGARHRAPRARRGAAQLRHPARAGRGLPAPPGPSRDRASWCWPTGPPPRSATRCSPSGPRPACRRRPRPATSSTPSTSPRAACTCCRAPPPPGGGDTFGIEGSDLLTPREAEVLELLQDGRHERRRSRTSSRSASRPCAPTRATSTASSDRLAARAGAPRAPGARGGRTPSGSPLEARPPAQPAASRGRCSSSATWTALVAAPLRRLSPTIQRFRQRSCEGSRRMRPTSTSSRPATSSAVG